MISPRKEIVLEPCAYEHTRTESMGMHGPTEKNDKRYLKIQFANSTNLEMQTCNNEHCQPIVHITVLAMASQPVVRSAHVAHRQSCGSLVIRQVNSKTKKLKIKAYKWNSNFAENRAHKTRRMCRPHAWTRNWMNNWKRTGRTQTNWNELKRDKFTSKLSSMSCVRQQEIHTDLQNSSQVP